MASLDHKRPFLCRFCKEAYDPNCSTAERQNIFCSQACEVLNGDMEEDFDPDSEDNEEEDLDFYNVY
jgi:hypothetical protein